MIYAKFDWNWYAGSGEDFFSIQTYVNIVFLIVAPPDPGDHDVNNSESKLYQKAFM
jgi:hypothetical protein